MEKIIAIGLIFVLVVVCSFLTADILYESIKLTAEDGTEGDSFGCSVSLANSFMIAGARMNDDDGWGAGCAYIFQRIGNSWQQDIKLNANDGSAYSFYGTSVAISGDLAVAGAPGHNTSGRVYVYRFSSNQWSFEAMLTASDASSFNYDSFGQSVHTNGGKILVGSPGKNFYQGAAYVFSRSGNNWVEEAILTAADGEEADGLGCSVQLNGVYAVVGAKGDDDNGQASGSAYIYRKTNGIWVEEAKLTADDGEEDDWLGFSVAMNSNKVLIGAQNEDSGGENVGAAYIWEWDGTEWIQQIKLVAADPVPEASFGISSIYGNLTLIGAYKDDDIGIDSGSAYLYQYHNNNWQEHAKCRASDGNADDNFGSSLSLFENSAAIGSPNNENMGAVYIYNFEPSDSESSEVSPPELNLQNYPNPFNPTTTISFNLTAKDSKAANIEIFNIKGQQIRSFPVILSGDEGQREGNCSITWNGRNQSGNPVPSGIYFYKLKAGREGVIKKMILLK